MSANLSAVAFYLKQSLAAASPGKISNGHIHELLAAALGHNNHASFTTAPEETGPFEAIEYVVIDQVGLARRVKELGHGAAPWAPTIAQYVSDAFRAARQSIGVYNDQQDLLDNVDADVGVALEESDDFGSAFAETNADSSDSVDDLEFIADETVADARGDWHLEVYASISLVQDQERPYAGHQIDMNAQVCFPKLGRRLLGAWELKEIGASVVHYDDVD